MLGAKSGEGVYQAIIALMPPHDTYIETHFGSGAVMRAKPPAERNIAIDLDPKMIVQAKANFSDRLMEFYQADAESFVAGFDYARSGRVLIYADPPYLHATRTSNKHYRFEYSEADHRRLLWTLKKSAAAVIISGYPSRLYDSLLVGWRTVEFQAMTRGGPRTERLWLNYPADAGVQWSTFAGENRTRRQNIKRKAERWAANYRRCSSGERAAILAALLAE